jgi:predicted Zn-dependent peptidase
MTGTALSAEPSPVRALSVERTSRGVRAVAVPRADAASVTVAVGVRAGSRDEQPGERGAAHLLEHLLMRGTDPVSGTEIAEHIDGFGGTLEPFVTRDWTCVAVQAPAAYARIAAETVLRITASPALSQESVEAERGVVLEEIRWQQRSARHVTVDAIPAEMFAGHPLGAPVTGSAAELAALDVEAVQGFHRRTYLNARLVSVVAVGAVRQDWLTSVVERGLGSLEAMPVSRSDPPYPRHGRVRRQLASDTTYVAVGVPGQPRRDAGSAAMSVINEVIGGGLSSRWVRRVRGERGLAYDVGSTHEAFDDIGLLTLYAGVPPESATEVEAEAHRLLDDLSREGPSEAEFVRARERALGRLYVETDHHYGMTWHTLERLLFSCNPDVPELSLQFEAQRLSRVTRREVIDLAHELADRPRVTCVGEASQA